MSGGGRGESHSRKEHVPLPARDSRSPGLLCPPLWAAQRALLCFATHLRSIGEMRGLCSMTRLLRISLRESGAIKAPRAKWLSRHGNSMYDSLLRCVNGICPEMTRDDTRCLACLMFCGGSAPRQEAMGGSTRPPGRCIPISRQERGERMSGGQLGCTGRSVGLPLSSPTRTASAIDGRELSGPRQPP